MDSIVGEEAVLRLAKTNNTVILPTNLSDVGSMIALATSVLRAGKDGDPARNTVVPPRRYLESRRYSARWRSASSRRPIVSRMRDALKCASASAPSASSARA